MVDKNYFEDLVGKKIGMLLVLGIQGMSQPDKKGKRETLINCLCDCGNSVLVTAHKLKRGTKQSCGIGHKAKRITEEERIRRKIDAINYHKNYRIENCEDLKRKKTAYLQKLKSEAISRYGGKCACCGETTMEFLTMEHMNGRKNSLVKKTGKSGWMQAKSLGWPEDITVLCYNCNCAKGAYGICPHQKK